VFTDRRTEGKKHHNISRRSLHSLGGYKYAHDSALLSCSVVNSNVRVMT